MADPRHPRGLIDTSVVIDLELIEPADLPAEIAVSAITMAELAAGPRATTDPAERARRQNRLQRAEATFEPLPVDTAVARAYGRVLRRRRRGGPQSARPPRSGSVHCRHGGGGGSALVHAQSGRFRWLVRDA